MGCGPSIDRSSRVGPLDLLLGDLGAAVPQADRDDDELGGIAGADADLDVELAKGLEAGRVVALVDPDVERLRGRVAEEGPGLPDAGEEFFDLASQALPRARGCSAGTRWGEAPP